MKDETVRGWVYLIATIAVACGLVISVVQKEYVQAGIFLAMLFPTGLATANTSRS